MVAIYDEVIPVQAYSRYTGFFPTMQRGIIYNGTEFNHVGVRDLTAHDQFTLITQRYIA